MFELINRKTYRLLFIIAVIVTLVATLSVVSKTQAVQLINDKLGHALMFFFLAFLCSHTLGRKYGVKAIALLALFGLAIELTQYYLPWRSFSVLDWIADIIGIIAYELIHRLKRAYYFKKNYLNKNYLRKDSLGKNDLNPQINLEEKSDV